MSASPHYDCEASLQSPSWDEEILRFPDVHPFQSAAFADHLSSQGTKPYFITITSAGEIVAMCLVGIRRQHQASWLFGPACAGSHIPDYAAITQALLSFLRDDLKVGVIRQVKTQVFYQTEHSDHPAWLPSQFSLAETPYVDLRQPLEQILRACDRSVRKNVRRCEESAVQVTFLREPEEIGPYLGMLEEFRTQRGFPLPPFFPNPETLRCFNRPHTAFEVAVAAVDGVPLAALGFLQFGSVLIEVAAAEAATYANYRLPLNDAIKIKAIAAFQARGAQIYDLSGINRTPADEKEQNIRRFKLKFTPNIAGYARLDRLFLSPWGYVSTALEKIAPAFNA